MTRAAASEVRKLHTPMSPSLVGPGSGGVKRSPDLVAT